MSSHLHVGFRSFVIYPCLAGERILKEKCLEIERGPERGRSGRGGAYPPPVSFFEENGKRCQEPLFYLRRRRLPPIPARSCPCWNAKGVSSPFSTHRPHTLRQIE